MSHARKKQLKKPKKTMSLSTSLHTQKSPIYLDYNATTPLHPEISAKISEVLMAWGNPSSIHWAGRLAKTIIREARQNLATALNASPLELVFTSGGSEANSTVLQNVFQKTKGQVRSEFITTVIEHPSVLKALAHFESQGAVVHRINVDREGNFDWEHFNQVLSEKTALVFVMLANNETGLMLPVKEITARAHSVGAKVHTDAVQAYGKIKLNLQDLNVDYAAMAAHKFYAFKGCGALFSKKGNELQPVIFGGGQERHRRGGTENTVGIWAMGLMAQKVSEVQAQAKRLSDLRDQMETQILAQIPNVRITQKNANRLPNTSSIVIDGLDGDTLLMSLDVKGFAVSTGSACSSGSPEPSKALRAMGLSREEAQSSLRVSLGWMTTEQEVKDFVQTLIPVVQRLRSIDMMEEREVSV